MASPTGIISESLMAPEHKAAVIEWLRAQPLEKKRKRELLFGWAITVGVRLKTSNYARAIETAIDATP